jgi:hypothetical protein
MEPLTMGIAPNQNVYVGKCIDCAASIYWNPDEQRYAWKGGNQECLHWITSVEEIEEDEKECEPCEPGNDNPQNSEEK